MTVGTGESAIRSGFADRPARAAASLSILAPRSSTFAPHPSIFPCVASDRGSAPDPAETLARPGNMSAPTLKTDRKGVENDQKSFKIDRKTASVIRRPQPSDSQNALVFPTNIAPSASATTWHTTKNRTRKNHCCKCPLQELFPPKSPIGNAWPRIMVAPCHGTPKCRAATPMGLDCLMHDVPRIAAAATLGYGPQRRWRSGSDNEMALIKRGSTSDSDKGRFRLPSLPPSLKGRGIRPLL